MPRPTEDEARRRRRAKIASKKRPAKKAAKKAPRPAKKAPRPVKRAAKKAPAKKKIQKRPARPAKKSAKKVARPAKRPAKKAAKKAVRPAKKAVRPAKKAAKKVVRPAKKAAKKAVRPAAKRPAKKVVRPAAKKPAKKVVRPAKKVVRPAKKAPVKKQPVKKQPPVKKAPVKKAPVKKAPAKKPRGPRFPPVSQRPEHVQIDSGGRERGKRRVKVSRTTASMKELIDQRGEFLASSLRAQAWPAKRHASRAYADETVDGEVVVAIPPVRATPEDILGSWPATVTMKVGLLDLIEGDVGQIAPSLEGVYVQFGFALAPEAQIERRDEKRPYKRYAGALRFGYSWYKFTKNPRVYKNGFGEEVASTTVFGQLRTTAANILKNHSRPPTGLLVRFAWSKDGRLHRRR